MRVDVVDLEGCGTATGTVVVIDVLRAFTTAALAFAAGAVEIRPVATIEEVFAAREADPTLLAMGEIEGMPVDGFDFDNSPAALVARADEVAGRVLVQRTTAGTQGLVRSVAAERLYAASFVNAGATARRIARDAPEAVTFVVSGRDAERDGDEDLACAEYLAALLRDEAPDPAPYLARIAPATVGRQFLDPDHPYPVEDMAFARDLDRVPLALVVERRDGRLVMHAEPA